MADKQAIQRHLSLTSDIKLSVNTPKSKGGDARKSRIMEHVKKSRG